MTLPTTGHKAELWQLIREGFTYIVVRCPKCGRASYVPWRLLGKVDLQWTVPDVASRMRCRTCGVPPAVESIRVIRRIETGPATDKGARPLDQVLLTSSTAPDHES